MATRVEQNRGKGGRPRRETVVVRVKLRLHPGEDDDLIAFFASLPERGRARAVIGALRSGDIHRVLVEEGIDDDQMADAFEGWLR
jgi:hypothetical protein